jgi:hypothetical protein
MLRIKKYLLVLVTASVIFGCGANISVDMSQDAFVAVLEKNLNKG